MPNPCLEEHTTGCDTAQQRTAPGLQEPGPDQAKHPTRRHDAIDLEALPKLDTRVRFPSPAPISGKRPVDAVLCLLHETRQASGRAEDLHQLAIHHRCGVLVLPGDEVAVDDPVIGERVSKLRLAFEQRSLGAQIGFGGRAGVRGATFEYPTDRLVTRLESRPRTCDCVAIGSGQLRCRALAATRSSTSATTARSEGSIRSISSSRTLLT